MKSFICKTDTFEIDQYITGYCNWDKQNNVFQSTGDLRYKHDDGSCWNNFETPLISSNPSNKA